MKRPLFLLVLLMLHYQPLLAQSPDSAAALPARAEGIWLSGFPLSVKAYYLSVGRYWLRQRHTWELEAHAAGSSTSSNGQFGLKGGWRFYPARRPHRVRLFLQSHLYAYQLRSPRLNPDFKDHKSYGIGLLVGQGLAFQLSPRFTLDAHWQLGAGYNLGRHYIPPFGPADGRYKTEANIYLMMQPFITLSYQFRNR